MKSKKLCLCDETLEARRPKILRSYTGFKTKRGAFIEMGFYDPRPRVRNELKEFAIKWENFINFESFVSKNNIMLRILLCVHSVNH